MQPSIGNHHSYHLTTSFSSEVDVHISWKTVMASKSSTRWASAWQIMSERCKRELNIRAYNIRACLTFGRAANPAKSLHNKSTRRSFDFGTEYS